MLYNKNWKPPGTKLMPWQKILLKAAEILEKDGVWVTGNVHLKKYKGNESYCLLGAIYKARGLDPADTVQDDYRGVYRNTVPVMKMAAYLKTQFDGLGEKTAFHACYSWNDELAHDKETVVKTIRDCVKAG